MMENSFLSKGLGKKYPGGTPTMKKKSSQGSVTFEDPASYRIKVKGFIPNGWTDRLEGMSIQQQKSGDGEHVTMLEGELVDQAALVGVLNSVYELHLPILSVECLDVC
jgi:hypothetical protein